MNTLKNNLYDFLLPKSLRIYLFGIFFCLVITAIIGHNIPILISQLFSSYGSNKFIHFIQYLGVLFVVEYINRLFYQVQVNKYVQKVIQRVRDITFRTWLNSHDVHLEGEVVKAEEDFTQGEVLARIMNDTEALRELVTSGSFAVIIDGVFILSSLFSFIKINYSLGIILISTELLAVAALIYGGRSMAQIFLKVRIANGKMARQVANICGGITQLFYTSNDNYAVKKGEKVFDDFLKVQLRANIWDSSYYSLAESLFPLLLVLIVLVVPYIHIKELALLALMIDLIQRSIGPIKSVASKISSIGRAYSGVKRIHEFIESLRGKLFISKESKSDKIFAIQEMHVEIPYFSFPKRGKNHETPFSLEAIDFGGRKGELIGIVGASGHGKSTLLNILAANIIPQTMEISLKGKDEIISFRGNDSKSFDRYKELISLVSQESYLFSQTIEFNLTLKKLNSEEQNNFQKFWTFIEEKISYVKFYNWNVNTVIEPRKLSLGQKQLLTALRALYLKRPIVLLDEISSGLDSFLEESLRKLILLLQQQSLTIIVTHRVETILEANQIFVMKDGKIEGKGTYHELLNSSDTFQKLMAELKGPH